MIKINKKWYITADKREYILVNIRKCVDKKTGEEKEYEKRVGYHSTVSSALTQYIRLRHRCLTAKKEMSIADAIAKFEELEKIVLKSANNTIVQYNNIL